MISQRVSDFRRFKRPWYISPFIVTNMESSRQTDGSIEATLRSALLDILTKENCRHAPLKKNGLSFTVLGSLARKEILFLSE